MEFEGHITAESRFNVVDIFKCHFRMHNLVILSFRKDMMIVQTMTNPCRMPNIDTKRMYTTMIPLSSMKNYEFNSNYEEVSIMVPRTLLDGKFGSKCINVVRTEPLGTSKKIAVEVTFDGFCKKRKNVEVYTLVSKLIVVSIIIFKKIVLIS